MTGADQPLTGKVVVITGASSGIGTAAARQLHRLGAVVHVVGRSPDRTAAVAAEMGTEPIVADFGRLADVRAAAAQVLERCDRLDVLVNNAGLWVGKRIETPDGNELMFQVNYLAPFLLTSLLTDLPARTCTARPSLRTSCSLASSAAGWRAGAYSRPASTLAWWPPISAGAASSPERCTGHRCVT